MDVGQAKYLRAAWKAAVELHESADQNGLSGRDCDVRGMQNIARKAAALRHSLAKAVVCFLSEKVTEKGEGTSLGALAEELFGEDVNAFTHPITD